MPLFRRMSEQQPSRASSGSISPGHFYVRMGGVFVLVLLTGLMSGLLIERNVISGGQSSNPGFTDLDAVVDIIDGTYYYRPTDPAQSEEFEGQLQQNAIMGMLSGLDDDYTTYLAPPDAERASNQLAGTAVGIGTEFFPIEGQAVISRVYPNTPAEESGLLAGDIVLRIDGQPVDATNWPRFASTIEGVVGSTIRMTVRRPGQTGSFDVDMERREYAVPSVAFRMIEGTDVGWIQIGIFGTNTTLEVDAALEAIMDQGGRRVILDLRGNGGGWVTSAQEVIGRFLDPDVGPALYEDLTPGRGGEESKPIISAGDDYYDLPLIVLTDGNTASSAEIVAGALHDYNRAMVVGEPTFGKGSVQRVFEMEDGSSLRVTFAEWLTPSKGRIQEEGINPDIEVTVGNPGEISSDPVLQTAVQLAQSGRTKPSDLANPVTPATPAT